MGQLVVTGATAVCSFGTVPATITATSQAAVMVEGKPAATIQDAQPIVNVSSFGRCTSLLNPQVAAATAAALGVLTPQPCQLVCAGAWIPTKPTVLVGGKPCLTSDCSMVCANGAGNIKITFAGQAKTLIT